MKAIIVGSDSPDMGQDIEIVEQRAVTFPGTAAECQSVVRGLIRDAEAADAALIFQTVPGQVAACLAREYFDTREVCLGETVWPSYGIGIIISLPGPRPGKVREVYAISPDSYYEFEHAVKSSNPRATVGYAPYDEMDVRGNVGYSPNIQPVYVEVDGPPMPFVFSHIEWLR